MAWPDIKAFAILSKTCEACMLMTTAVQMRVDLMYALVQLYPRLQGVFRVCTLIARFEAGFRVQHLQAGP